MNKTSLIQKSLNSLVIDDNESSISYNKSDIDSNYIYQISFNDLLAEYKSDHDSLFTINAKKYFSIILSDDTEISLPEYQNIYQSNNDVNKPSLVFLKVANDALVDSGNEILIELYSIETKGFIQKRFQTEHAQVPGYRHYYEDQSQSIFDYTGYENCQRIKRNIQQNPRLMGTSPVLDYCDEHPIVLNGHRYECYIPAVGQIYFLKKFNELISFIFQKLNIVQFNINTFKCWTSTEYSEECIYYSDFDVHYRSANCYIYPIYKKIN